MPCDAGMVFFFFNDTATTAIYTLSLHDALPIYQPDEIGSGKMVGHINRDRDIRPWERFGYRVAGEYRPCPRVAAASSWRSAGGSSPASPRTASNRQSAHRNSHR